ncbi:RDD family protein [Chryseobacterium oranimense G311]|uniref:RDD family protein n=1 Tax=Chryseobacterium oranimense TaxID=421058 RepID=UPI00053394A5|nr:RDD family protein [Chryseobacterium oranimense]CEJ71325.1 RDD family protein [Chryseobacterium oranimense G311]
MENNLFLSKFWSRVWALLIDSLILGIFGYILGSVFENFLISLREEAKLIGWFISLAYFSILNSKLNNGQTIGKKIMKIQVTDIEGRTVSLKTSFIRSLILTAPFFLNGFKITGSETFSVVNIIQSMIIFTLGLGIMVFYIFNKETRQSLHDIVAKTYVVQDHRNNTVTMMPQPKKLPFYITGALLLLVIITSVYSYSSNSEIKKLLPVYEKVSQQNHVLRASISMNHFSGNKQHVYTISIKTDKKQQYDGHMENDPVIKEAVETFLNSNVYDSDQDVLNVVIGSGFDIGIARQNYSYNVFKPIFKWRETYKL